MNLLGYQGQTTIELRLIEINRDLSPINLPSNAKANTLKDGLAAVRSKVLLTATPLQNALLELYGLISIIDERVFGDLDSFRRQLARLNDEPYVFLLSLSVIHTSF